MARTQRVASKAGIISEKAFRATILELARMQGWLVYFTWRSDHSPSGFPDLVMVRGDQLVFAELKVAGGSLTPSQRQWLDCLAASGAQVCVWRPDDWEEIERVLGPPDRSPEPEIKRILGAPDPSLIHC